MSDDIVQRVKDAADIVEVVGEHVTLQRAGSRLKGLCPFHAEKTPSFFVNPATQTFHCFGCNEGGDVLTFLMRYHNLEFPEALGELARRYHIPLPARTGTDTGQRLRLRRRLEEINRQAAAIYHDFLRTSPQAAGARAYLEERRIPESVVERFQLGYAPEDWQFISRRLAGAYSEDLLVQAGLLVRKEAGRRPYDRFRNRLLCPIFQVNGVVAGFGGRIIGDGQPKYLNTDKTPLFDKSRLLYGLYQNRQAIRQARKAVLVEGNFDLLAMAAAGMDLAVAPLGTALTGQQVRILKGYADQVVVLFDGDAAGRKAAMRALPLFLAEMVEARVALLPAGHDPDSLLRDQGKEALEAVIAGARDLTDFAFDHLAAEHGLSVTGKARIAADLQQLVAPLAENDVKRTLLLDHFSRRLQVPVAQLAGGGRRRPPPAERTAAATPAPAIPVKHRQLLEFLLCWPAYLEAFVAAGVEEVFHDSPARNILQRLVALAATDPQAPPEAILGGLEGWETALVTGILARSPDYTEETVATMATEMLAWLRAQRHRQHQHRITQAIAEAQRQGDHERLLQLLAEKNALDAADKESPSHSQ